jgi:DNA-binding NtrC family response regulator
MSRPRVLVVDDKENMLRLFERILGEAYELETADSGTRALALLTGGSYDVVVSDIRMPDADGFVVLQEAKRRSPETEVILMTAYASVPAAVEAMKQGAYDYLAKPFDPDDAALVVARALERKRLRDEAASLRRELAERYGFERLVGKSPAMREVYALLERAAGLDITVLLTGETGTGKELAARAIHYRSTRREKRFVAINCGALPAELVESELFGHARGAFSGALSAKPGLFEEAEGGTLLLDEIGELPVQVQVKLNRALQEREVRRVGETRPIKTDVRVIAATHRDLKAEAQAGRFREDLYYRLNVFPVRLPPLRERREDIPLLAAHFVEKHARAHRRAVTGLDIEALRALTGYPWPGNVRELENAIERAVAVARAIEIAVEDLPAEVRDVTEDGPLPSELLVQMTYKDVVNLARDRVSRDYLTALMREFGGNVTRAAERASVERETLHRLLKRYGIRSDDFKRGE